MKYKIRLIFLLSFIAFFSSSIAQPFIPGNTYFDATGYVEYRAGNLPIILSAPHGGDLEPTSIPDRDCIGCVYTKDSWTQTITEGMYDEIVQATGCYPHVIINLLHRRKFDANRDIGEATDGNATVEQSWYGYHEFIDSAKAKVVEEFGRGLFLDIHGHAHTIQRIELGYLLSGAELRLTDAMLNTSTYIEESSVQTLVGDNIQGHTHAELLRGTDSFGTLLKEKGFDAVPSLSDPFPMVGEDYFSGGYNTVRHGSRDNAGEIDAIQVELNQDVRFNSITRAILIDSLSASANEYIDLHYDDQYTGNFCSLISPVELVVVHQPIRLFPNPSSTGKVTLDYFAAQEEDMKVSVYDVAGRLVFRQSKLVIAGENHLFYDFSTIGKGLFIVKVSEEKGERFLKMVID